MEKQSGCAACDDATSPLSVERVRGVIAEINPHLSPLQVSQTYFEVLRVGALHDLHSHVIKMLGDGSTGSDSSSYVDQFISEVLRPKQVPVELPKVDYEDDWNLDGVQSTERNEITSAEVKYGVEPEAGDWADDPFIDYPDEEASYD